MPKANPGGIGEKKINLAMVRPAVRAGKISSPINANNLILAFVLAACVLSLAVYGEESREHDVGSGPEDWWIGYPDQHSNAGSEVDHPSWALDPLEEKAAIILIHRTGCPACLKQDEAIRKVLGDLGDDATYLDVLSDDDFEKAWEGLIVYYPSGDPSVDPLFVPLTVVLTLVPATDGGAEVAWHSIIGWSGEGSVRSYLNDAIALYDDNSEGWVR